MVRWAWLLVDLEDAVGGGTAGMDHAFGNALVIEVRDLLAHQDVFEQRRPAHTGLQRILVVADGRRPGWSSIPRRGPASRAQVDGLVGLLRRQRRLVAGRHLARGARRHRRQRLAGLCGHRELRRRLGGTE